jgi:hypothetical protein
MPSITAGKKFPIYVITAGATWRVVRCCLIMRDIAAELMRKKK